MAERNFAENLDFSENISTGGDLISKQLYFHLTKSIGKAKSIDIIVAFLMESGMKLLLKDLKSASEKNVKIRLLTGNYLGITEPSALYLAKRELGENLDLRFYNDPKRSFHPKAYFFHHEDFDEVYVGSSNISYSAMKHGIEWNYCLNSNFDPKAYSDFFSEFNSLFYNHSVILDDERLEQYSRTYHKSAIHKQLAETEELFQNRIFSPKPEPRGSQIEALYALQSSREQGETKALIHAATGIGKTYLAAFDSENFKKVLFVAHREEILRQAYKSFSEVRGYDTQKRMGFFTGEEKTTGLDIIFASVETLGQEKYLSPVFFPRDYFDYIVIDEFHHAVSKNYRNIIDYFTPKFLLGLTATPDRMDGKDIYALLDYNVPYEITLQEGINKGLLSPFRYYGIYDETDYSSMRFSRGHYDSNELNFAYIQNENRSNLILKHFQKHNSSRAIGFCASKEHAEYMAGFFTGKGIFSTAVYSNASGKFSMERKLAVKLLEERKLRVIFCVDMFNEGVDIPSLDTVMFLRPTESPVVFLQQLGRGLRKSKGKNFLTVLDFIGNYKMASKIPSFLIGNKDASCGKINSGKIRLPDDCIIDFDIALIDLFSEMEKKKIRLHEKILSEYNRIKEEIGHVPSRMELFSLMDDETYNLCTLNSKENILKNYIPFLASQNDLNEGEKILYNSIAREFLAAIETTNMTKVYKMPVLLSFISDDKIKIRVSYGEILESWKKFFGENSNWRDLGIESFKDFKEISDKEHLQNIKKNPVNFLAKSGNGFFIQTENGLELSENIATFLENPEFLRHFKDIIFYRIAHYYQSRYRGKAVHFSNIAYKIPEKPLLMVADSE